MKKDISWQIILTIFIICMLISNNIFADGDTVWQSNGLVICNASGDQRGPEITSDGSGGAIVTWWDGDIYTQKINSSGVVQWTTNGVIICNVGLSQWYPKIITDGSGGAILAWWDTRNGFGDWDIYAQKINNSGVVQWTTNGVVISNATNEQLYSEIISDSTGGAIITWEDYRSSNGDIYVQRINNSGTVQWTANGETICNAVGQQYSPHIASDGSGGAIITWRDYSIYAQKINSSGIVQWTLNGETICSAGGDQWYPKITSDGSGGAIIIWQDRRSGDWNIYTQKINSSGVIQWAVNGMVICNAAGDQYSLQITDDGSGGAIIVWQDWRSGNADIYAQKINSAGAVQWTANGVIICNAGDSQEYPQITSDGIGGATITWWDNRNGNADIYAQKINSAGAVQWTPNGVIICNASDSQKWPQITSDSIGKAIITWEDYRNGGSDIYAQRVCWPKIITINPDSGYAGTSVTIIGTGYANTQGSGKVYFNGVDAGSANNWSDTKIVINIPANATSGNCTIVVNGQISDTKYFTVWTKIDTINPNSGYVGTSVVISGNGYGSIQGNSKVHFNGIDAGSANSWNSMSITINIPSITSAGILGCTVLVNEQISNSCSYVLKPEIIEPDSGYVKTSVTINGSGYGDSQGSSKAYFNGIDAGTANNWSSTSITIDMPLTIEAGVVSCTVLVNGQVSNSHNFILRPKINVINPDLGYAGLLVVIRGIGYGNNQGTSKIYFNGIDAGSASSWDSGNIIINIPLMTSAGSLSCTVVVNSVESNTKYMKIYPKIDSLTHIVGYAGLIVTITGSGFGTEQGGSKIYFNGKDAGNAESWNSTTIQVKIPKGATPGKVTVKVNDIESEGKEIDIKMRITTDELGKHYIAMQISEKIEVDAGEEPYKFEIITGKLPKGLSLNTNTGEITGSPSESGEFLFTVKVTDKNEVFETKEFKLEIKAIKPEEKLVVRKNLFNPAKGENTVVQFRVEKKTRVEVKIYNETGKLVKTLVDREHEEGTFSEKWNGKDIGENVVSSGVYLIHIQIDNESVIKKVMVIK